jgi:hypothetical protein
MLSMNLPCVADASSYLDSGGTGTSTNGLGGSWNILEHSMGYSGIPFLKFDLSALDELSTEITKAELRFYYYGHQDYDPPFVVKRALADWDEATLCWNNQPQRSQEVYLTHPPLAANFGWQSLDIKTLLLYWKDGLHPNYGLALESTASGYRYNSYCYSRQYSNGEYAPYIYVEYGTPSEYAIPNAKNISQGKLLSTLSANTATTSIRKVNLTNGVIDTDIYIDVSASTDAQPVKLTLDLGHVCKVCMIKVWHYFADSRIYNNSIVEVSENGTDWTTIFDSAISGTYAETMEGKEHAFAPMNVRYIRDGINGSNINTGNHWVELQVWGKDLNPDTKEILPCIADTWTNDQAPTTNYGASTFFACLYYYSYDYDAWLRFNIANLKDKGVSKVNSAILKTYYYYSDIPDRIQKNEIYPITSNWDENTMTYNTRPSWSNAVSTLESPSNNSYGYGWRLADVTNLVNYWLSGVINEYGIRIDNSGVEQQGSPGAGDWSYMNYYSKEYNSGAFAPHIEVQYDSKHKLELYRAVPYSGATESVELPSGDYCFRLWGGRGADGYDDGTRKHPGGLGGYAEGRIILEMPTVVKINVGGGQVPYVQDTSAKFNGGGTGGVVSRFVGGGGGGATDIRIGASTLNDRILVAGGGGGGGAYYSGGGAGGGLTGGGSGSMGSGGTQTAGGSEFGTFGIGGNADDGSGGGGGGWYGGGGGQSAAYGGGGGSSYIGGTVSTHGADFPVVPIIDGFTAAGYGTSGNGKCEIWRKPATDVFGRRLVQII